jgi:hypothetical protein
MEKKWVEPCILLERIEYLNLDFSGERTAEAGEGI